MRQNSASFRNDQGEKLAVIRAKIEANGCLITVDFSKKGFYSTYTQPTFVQQGRLGKIYQLFDDELQYLLSSLKDTLMA